MPLPQPVSLFLSPPTSSFAPSVLRNNPAGGQQEGAPHRPDPPGAAAGGHLWQEPPRAPLPHAGPGRPRGRVLQAGGDKGLPDHRLRPSPQRLAHLPLRGHEEADHMLRGSILFIDTRISRAALQSFITKPT